MLTFGVDIASMKKDRNVEKKSSTVQRLDVDLSTIFANRDIFTSAGRSTDFKIRVIFGIRRKCELDSANILSVANGKFFLP